MDLGARPNTVAKAHRILAAGGWLKLRRRRGATVLQRPVPRAGEDALSRWRQRLEELIVEGLARGLNPAQLVEALAEAAAPSRRWRRQARMASQEVGAECSPTQRAMSEMTWGATWPGFSYSAGEEGPSPAMKRWLSFG
ncbi:MAG: hypothetical protein GXP47_09690 [Acidobacteria bacterium]|nr:hypothetical protein [Acidobacteriota bacterium]